MLNKRIIKILVVGRKGYEDSISRTLKTIEGLEIITTDNQTLKPTQVAVIPNNLKDKIDEIDFSTAQEYQKFEQPKLPDVNFENTKSYFEKMRKKDNQIQSEQIRYRSNSLSKQPTLKRRWDVVLRKFITQIIKIMSENKNSPQKALVISVNAKINCKLNLRKYLIDLANDAEADVIIKSTGDHHEITLCRAVQDLSNPISIIDAINELQVRLSNICALLLVSGVIQKDPFKDN